MYEPSEQYQYFRDKLRELGVIMRCSWQARRDGKAVTDKHPHDIEHVTFTGSGFQPSVLSAVIIDYGKKDGFGCYVDNVPGSMDELAALIATPRPEPGAVSDAAPVSGTLDDPEAIAKRLAAMGRSDQIIASALALHALTTLFREIFGKELAGHFQLNTLEAIDKLLKSAGIDALAAAVTKLTEPADGPWQMSGPEDGDGDDTVLVCNDDAPSYEVIRINDGGTEERKDIAEKIAALLNRGRATLEG